MKKLLLIFSISTIAFAQVSEYQFISPAPGSENNTRESTIILRQGTAVDEASLSNAAIFVSGSKSGKIEGEIALSSDDKTIIFRPGNKFEAGETILVNLLPSIKLKAGGKFTPAEFSFKVAEFDIARTPLLSKIRDFEPLHSDRLLSKAAADSVPSDFPKFNVEVFDSAALGEGYIFLTVSSNVEGIGYYTMMLNNDGAPFFYYKSSHNYTYDFKVQPNGRMSFAQFKNHYDFTGGGEVEHMILDNSLTIVDSVQMGNGYIAEAHDFQILSNGHYLLFGYYLVPVDMSKYVDGGFPNAYVSGGIVQELDADKNVIFQWRSWDHYSFESYSWGRRATNPIVSEFHLNSISLDTDGNIFIGTPKWTKKLNRQTGEIMWHLGGNENQFQFVGADSLEGVDHFGGHGFYRLENGHVIIYNNGGGPHPSPTSMVHEYILDEENLIATHVWTYKPPKNIAGKNRGNAQRLPNGNTIICWGGSNKPVPAFTEINSAGKKLMEISFANSSVGSYRAFRFPFNGGKPAADVIVTEVAAGNTYGFNQADTAKTGVSIKVNTFSGSGYNELEVKRYQFGPVASKFIGKAPLLVPRRMVLSSVGLSQLDADISFDATNWQLSNPSGLTVYHREFEGKGVFLPLSTSYNPVTKELTAGNAETGEFIIGRSDIASVALPPILNEPRDSARVNQNFSVDLTWSPRGFDDTYTLVISKMVGNAQQLVAEVKDLKEATYNFTSPESNAIYRWQVKTLNDAGESDFSTDRNFFAVTPEITLLEPNGGEEIQRGLKYFVTWRDNIEEDVEISLINANDSASVLGYSASDRAYEWSLSPTMETGDYQLRITSTGDSAVYDVSDTVFTVIDTVTAVQESEKIPDGFQLFANYPNPFNPVTQIRFALPQAEKVKLSVFNVLGELQALLLDENVEAGVKTVSFNASGLNSGVYVYKIEAGTFTDAKKMILLK